MRLNIDAPQIQQNDLPIELNKWFANIVDQINHMFGNVIADIHAIPNGGGAGPISIAIPGMTAESVVTASIATSTNAVTIQKVTATATGFDVLFSGDPGNDTTLNYIAFLTNWAAQGA